MSADIPGLDGRVAVDHRDPLDRDAELLGDDHGEHRLRPLADLASAGEERERAEVVELHDGAAAVGAIDARAAADMEHGGIADAALPARARPPRRRPRDLLL